MKYFYTPEDLSHNSKYILLLDSYLDIQAIDRLISIYLDFDLSQKKEKKNYFVDLVSEILQQVDLTLNLPEYKKILSDQQKNILSPNSIDFYAAYIIQYCYAKHKKFLEELEEIAKI